MPVLVARDSATSRTGHVLAGRILLAAYHRDACPGPVAAGARGTKDVNIVATGAYGPVDIAQGQAGYWHAVHACQSNGDVECGQRGLTHS